MVTQHKLQTQQQVSKIHAQRKQEVEKLKAKHELRVEKLTKSTELMKGQLGKLDSAFRDMSKEYKVLKKQCHGLPGFIQQEVQATTKNVSTPWRKLVL